MQRSLVLLLLLAATAAAQQEPKKLGKKDRLFQERINEAVDRGVRWLGKRQAPDGTWPSQYGAAGSTSLALYTLAVLGKKPGDPMVKAATTALDKFDVKGGNVQDLVTGKPAIRMTYDHSLLILALATLDAKAHRKRIAKSVSALVRSQKKNGQWAYIISMGGPLDNGDNSNTQFALLALRLAATKGFNVPRAVWRRSYDHFRRTIDPKGGWGYGCRGSLEGTYGSMTAVAVASLVISKAMMVGEDKAAAHPYLSEPEIARGMIWLEENFEVKHHPGIDQVKVGPPGGMGGGGISSRAFHYYWLYSVERVGMLLSRRHIGTHDWYREGAAWLLSEQEADGSWESPGHAMMAPEPPLAATCFALLFLKKATLPVVTPAPR